jgi:thioredoxin-related protein
LKTLILHFILFLSATCFAQEYHDANATFRQAAEAKKPVLLIFSGSDWCAPCMQFDKNVFSSGEFQSFIQDNLYIVKADFPQRKQLPETQKKQNEELAETYNPKGLFPHLVLLRPDQSVLTTLVYSHQSPSEFIAEIKRFYTDQGTSSK